MIGRLTAISVSFVVVMVACGIPGSGDVSRVPDDDLGALIDTLPTTSTTTTTLLTVESTTTTIALSTTTTIATEDATLYFINGDILVPFTRALRKGASSGEVLAALQEGPPLGVLGVGLRTAVPTQDEGLLTVKEDDSGVATVDLPASFYDTISQPADQRLAIGQIVLTLTLVGRIGQVLFTKESVQIGVPRGAGDLSQPGQPLPPRDYLELLASPAATTTTTTTTIPPTSTSVV